MLLLHICILQPQSSSSSSSCCFFVGGEGSYFSFFFSSIVLFFYFLTFNSYDRKHIEEHLQVSHLQLGFLFVSSTAIQFSDSNQKDKRYYFFKNTFQSHQCSSKDNRRKEFYIPHTIPESPLTGESDVYMY